MIFQRALLVILTKQRILKTKALQSCPQRMRLLSSSSDDLVTIDFDHSNGVATLTMQNKPVNSMSLEMNQALLQSIRTVEEDANIQSLILSSWKPSIFSAGLNLSEMVQPDVERLTNFWKSFQDLYITFYGSRLACIAAVKGHAVAGGCMLALCCDYRIMVSSSSTTTKQSTIGLNESKVGIVAPYWLGQQYIDTIGRRNAEKALTLGTLFTPEEALKINLIDEILMDPDENKTIKERAKQVAKEFSNIPPDARFASKMLIRKERIDDMKSKRDQDLNDFVTFITSDKTQNYLGNYMAMLAKKKKK